MEQNFKYWIDPRHNTFQDRGQQKTMKLVFAAPMLSTQHWQLRAMTGWPRIRIMGWRVYPRTVLSVCQLSTNSTKPMCLVQIGHHHYVIDMLRLLAMAWLNNCLFSLKQQSLTLIGSTCFNLCFSVVVFLLFWLWCFVLFTQIIFFLFLEKSLFFKLYCLTIQLQEQNDVVKSFYGIKRRWTTIEPNEILSKWSFSVKRCSKIPLTCQ